MSLGLFDFGHQENGHKILGMKLCPFYFQIGLSEYFIK